MGGLRLVVDGPAGLIECGALDVDLRGTVVFSLAAPLRARGVPVVFATGFGAVALPREWAGCPRVEKRFEARALGAALRSALRSPRRALLRRSWGSA